MHVFLLIILTLISTILKPQSGQSRTIFLNHNNKVERLFPSNVVSSPLEWLQLLTEISSASERWRKNEEQKWGSSPCGCENNCIAHACTGAFPSVMYPTGVTVLYKASDIQIMQYIHSLCSKYMKATTKLPQNSNLCPEYHPSKGIHTI